MIDTSFDFRTDTPSGKDPDTHSPTLRRYHRFLWSKTLPGGALFDLGELNAGGMYLRHHSATLGEFVLSSDAVMPTFTRWGFAKEHPEICSEKDNDEFFAIAYARGR
jgi:hypothetical protein